MSQEVAAEPATSVVEWGEEPGRRFLGRWSAGRRIVMPAVSRQVVPVLAGLSGLALFASLVGEWQVTVMAEGPGDRVVTAGVASVQGWGVSYLVGMFGLVSCVALAMFGARRSRRNVRVVGLTLTAALAVMLAAATKTLAENSAIFSFFGIPEESTPEISIGRGLHMAYVATLGFGLALHLAARFWPAPAESADAAAGRGTDAERMSDGVDNEPVRRNTLWRRRVAAANADSGPADLTVSRAAPFAHFPDAKERG